MKVRLHNASHDEDGSVLHYSDMVHAFPPSDLFCSFSTDSYIVDEGNMVELVVIVQQNSSLSIDKIITCQGVSATGEYI